MTSYYWTKVQYLSFIKMVYRTEEAIHEKEP